MKRIATIVASALVALGMGLIATAASKTEKVQPAEGYVKVDKDLFKKAAENIVKGAKDITEKDKSYFNDLLEKAFDKYTTDESSKVKVYDKAAIEGLKTEIKVWQDSVKKLNKNIAEKEKQNKGELKQYNNKIDSLNRVLAKENIDGRIQAINEKHRNDSNARAKEIAELKNEIIRLRADSADLAGSKAELAKDAEIVQKVMENVEKLGGKVDKLHDRYLKESTLPSVDSKEVANTLKEYEGYLKTIGIEVSEDQKEKMEFVRAVARVAEYYNKGKVILSNKYDAKAVKMWNDDLKSMTASVSKLNSDQKQQWQNMMNAFSTIDAANKNFKVIILPYLKEQGQIPGDKEAKEVKDMIASMVSIFAKGKYKDTTKYHELHENLNKVLNNTLNGLKEMDKKQYRDFVDDLEKSL